MRTLRVLEITAWTAGILMLGTYTGVRWWYASARDEALASFEAARSSDSGVEASTSASASLAEVIDTSDWSAERVELYRRALEEKRAPEAQLRIPSVKLIVPVFEGVSDWSLNRGAGRVKGTARIGEPGNVGIAAHRDGFFRALKDVRVGDLLILDRIGSSDTYRIVATYIVDPAEISVLESTTTPSVTLVTCYPFYFVGSAPRRFIVRAQLTVQSENTPAGHSH